MFVKNSRLKFVSISGSINLPMNTIVNRINELDKEDEYAVICHSGIRSLHVCNYLNNLVFSVKNVVMGLTCGQLYVITQ